MGNEQWGQQYFERYAVFAKVLKEKHPEIELVSGAGPFPADAHFKFAWPLLRELKADIVDEHCYAMPDWFLRSATRYDDYDRSGPKVFMGEYAAQSIDICSPDNRNNLRCALAEAAFMTGLERNSDVVVMSSYAPLFGHEEAWQWRPNLIWFDNLAAYATPNYYVQQLFSQNRGDVVLAGEAERFAAAAAGDAGGIGLATIGASAEFEDLRVTHDGETLLDAAIARRSGGDDAVSRKLADSRRRHSPDRTNATRPRITSAIPAGKTTRYRSRPASWPAARAWASSSAIATAAPTCNGIWAATKTSSTTSKPISPATARTTRRSTGRRLARDRIVGTT